MARKEKEDKLIPNGKRDGFRALGTWESVLPKGMPQPKKRRG